MAGGLHEAQQVLPAEPEGGGGDAWVAADKFILHQLPVYDQRDMAVCVKEQLQSGYRAGNGLQIVPHVAAVGKGQPGAAQLGGEKFGLEGLVAGHHQQVEIGLLPVAQKQVLADVSAQHLFHLMAELDGVGVVVVHPDIGDFQLLQPVVDGQLLGDAAVGGAGGVAGLIDVHGIAPSVGRDDSARHI